MVGAFVVERGVTRDKARHRGCRGWRLAGGEQAEPLVRWLPGPRLSGGQAERHLWLGQGQLQWLVGGAGEDSFARRKAGGEAATQERRKKQSGWFS